MINDRGMCIPSWHQTLGPERFVIVMNNEAVLDRETGLVWERSLLAPKHSAYAALSACLQNKVGNRKGWRLPSIEELASLIDDTQASPALPAGHPFNNVQPDIYWTGTIDNGSTDQSGDKFIWRVNFADGMVLSSSISTYAHVWRVRGGQNCSTY